MDVRPEQLTQLLESWSQGDQAAMDRLMPLVYDDLRRLAHRYMAGERPGHTLQTTALVSETYLRLVGAAQTSPESRAHFFAICSRLMRQILVDWARGRKALKRGSDLPSLELQEQFAMTGQPGADLVALDDALEALAKVDGRKAQVIELRFFGGLSVDETANVLRVSEETVHRDWRLARSWLRRELRKESSRGQ